MAPRCELRLEAAKAISFAVCGICPDESWVTRHHAHEPMAEARAATRLQHTLSLGEATLSDAVEAIVELCAEIERLRHEHKERMREVREELYFLANGM